MVKVGEEYDENGTSTWSQSLSPRNSYRGNILRWPWRNLTHFHQITMTISSNRTCGPHLPRAWRAQHCLSVLRKYASAQSRHEKMSDKRKLRQSAKYQLVFFIHNKVVKDTETEQLSQKRETGEAGQPNAVQGPHGVLGQKWDLGGTVGGMWIRSVDCLIVPCSH